MLYYQTFPSLFYLHTLCNFINFCCLITFYVIYAPYKCTYCTHHNFPSCLIVCTLSAPIHLSNSPGVFGHCAILIWGDRDVCGGGGFSKSYLSPSNTIDHTGHCFQAFPSKVKVMPYRALCTLNFIPAACIKWSNNVSTVK